MSAVWRGSSGSYTLNSGTLSMGWEHIAQYGTGTFTQTGGTNTVTGDSYIGNFSGALGTYTLSGGTHTVGRDVYLGHHAGGTGVFELSGTGSLSALNEYVGDGGTGTFTQTGGTNAVSDTLYLAHDSGSTGTYTLSGGTLTVGSITGGSGTSTFNFNGGTLQAGSSATGTFMAGLTNAYIQSGGANIDTNGKSITISQALLDGGGGGGLTKTGSGTLTLSGSSTYTGATSVTSGTLAITGSLAGGGTFSVSSGGAATLASGAQLRASNQWVGNSGTGTFTNSGGTNTVTSNLYLGYSSGSSGSYSLSDSGRLSASLEYVGYNGAGIFVQRGGTNSLSSLHVGYAASATGTYVLSGSGTLTVDWDHIGQRGTGLFVQTGGTHTVTGDTYIGNFSGATGTYLLSGGTHTVGRDVYLGHHADGTGVFELGGTGSLSASNEYVGDGGTGTFTQTDGTNTVSNTLYLAHDSGSTGTYTLSGGTLTAKSIAGGSGTSTFNFNGGTLLVAQGASSNILSSVTTAHIQSGGANIDTHGQNVAVAQSLLDGGGGGGLTKTGSGSLILNAANTYTGKTAVNAGTLVVNHEQALQNSTLNTSGAGAVSFGSVNSATVGGLEGTNDLALTNSSSSAVALTVGKNGTGTTFSGALTGSGSLTKIGLSTLTLTGNSTYTGGTSILGGTIVAASDTAMGTGEVFIAGAGTLRITAGTTIANKISNSSTGQIISDGSTTVTLSAGSSLKGWQSTSGQDANTTTATILAGSTTADTTLSATWDTSSISTGTSNLYSNILQLNGTGNSTFVLQMSYDEASVKAAGIDEASLVLSWLDANGTWVNAVSGNTTGTASGFGGAYDAGNSAMNQLGAYGVDTQKNVVWAVINHNSDFSVTPVPEPTTLAMLAGGAIALGFWWRRRRKSLRPAVEPPDPYFDDDLRD